LKIILIFAKVVFIICLPLLIFSISIAGAINSPWLYTYGFNKYDVSQTTGLPDTELQKAADGIISYFNSGEEFINVTVLKDGHPFQLLNQREAIHLKDVKGLFWLVYYILLGTLIYVLFYVIIHFFWRKGKYSHLLTWRVIGGSGLTLVLMLVFGIAVAVNFELVFLQFHVFSFANDFWQLNPSTDHLIMLFPDGFWFDSAVFIALAAGGLAVLTGCVTGSIHFFKKARQLTAEAERL
jgi:integral membrane protein (TIGR01906 family)